MQLYVDLEWFSLTPLFITWSIHWTNIYKIPSLNGSFVPNSGRCSLRPWRKKPMSVMSAVSAAHPAPRASVALGGEKQAASEQSPRRVPKCQGLFLADSFQIKKRAAERFWFGNIERGWYLYNRLQGWDQKPVLHGVFGAPIICIGL